MRIVLKNNRQILLKRVDHNDFDRLNTYFQELSSDTLKRYGPHQFDLQSITELYINSDMNMGYIAINIETSEIIAYSIIRIGFLEHDSSRLRSYGLMLNHNSDCTFAPSVSDTCQSLGIGNHLFQFMLSDLKVNNFKRIILWGGVQSDNEKAINFYFKNGFRKIGEFEYHGLNYDMILEIV